MKKLLVVCFCLLAAASMSMAAEGYNTVATWGTFDVSDAYGFLAVEDPLNNYFQTDDFYGTVKATVADLPAGFECTDWNMADMYEEYFKQPINFTWNHLLLFTDGGEWYLFADDFVPGFLTTPTAGDWFDPLQGEGGLFNDSRATFDNIWFIAANNAPAVPEPGSLLLLGSGIVGLGFAVKRRLNK